MLSVIILSVAFFYCYAECRYPECRIFYCYAEYHYAEYHYAEYRYAEWRGSIQCKHVLADMWGELKRELV